MDYTRIKLSSAVGSILWLIIFCYTIYRWVTAKDLWQSLICCIMFIAIILMLGWLIVWWENRPED